MRCLILIVFISFVSVVTANEKEALMYEISCAGNAAGYYVVEVSAYVSVPQFIHFRQGPTRGA